MSDEKLRKKYRLALEYLVDSELVLNVHNGIVEGLTEDEWDEYLEREIEKEDTLVHFSSP